MLATASLVLLVSSALAASPWPIEAPARVVATPVEDPGTVIPPPPTDPLATPSEPAPAPSVPAPAQPSASTAPVSTKSSPTTPTPAAKSIPPPNQPRTKETLRDYAPKQRRMVIAAYVLTGASLVPIAFQITGLVKMVRADRRLQDTPPSDVDEYEARRAEVLHQSYIVIGTGMAGLALCTTALVLLLVARRQHKRDVSRRRSPPPRTAAAL